ncbi:MAG: hypothetical protein P8M17_02725 [Saprospiraceae bacterium]|nr:hypothetical protein [Saprospiraceae bacterium]MDG2417879.1 hypothetical protein [Saprospiraceae bacterium]
MKKRIKNKFLPTDSIIPKKEDYDNMIHEEREYDESARLKKLVLLFAIPLFFILGFLFKSKFNPEIQYDKLEEHQATLQEKINEKKIAEINQMVSDAKIARKKDEFDKAVFLFRQAISYEPKNIDLHINLLLTLEESCKNENEIHCNSIVNVKEKLEKLKGN